MISGDILSNRAKGWGAVILAALLFGACQNAMNGDARPATTTAAAPTTPPAPPDGNLSSSDYTGRGTYVQLPDGRRQNGCSSTDTVYAGNGTCHVGGETVVVREVIDGDTVDLNDGRRVRILGVDAPEVGTCGADEATAYTRGALIGNRLVVLHREPGVTQDQHGLELGYLQYVHTESDTDKYWAAPASQDLGANLAIEGLAEVYEGGGANATYMEEIRSSVDIAKQVHGGVWGPPCGEPAQTYEPAPVDESDSDVYVDTDDDDDGESWPCRRSRWC
jgi:endonuclease YncB( thermonuclease family)